MEANRIQSVDGEMTKLQTQMIIVALESAWTRRTQMDSFDFMGFGYDDGSDDMLVANANKYSAQDTVDICKEEEDEV